MRKSSRNEQSQSYFFHFNAPKTRFQPECEQILKNTNSVRSVYSFKFQSSTRNLPFFQSLRPVATNAKSYSVFLLKSARNCPPSKSCPKSKSLSNDKSQSMSQKRTVRQRFFNQESVSFSIFCSCT